METTIYLANEQDEKNLIEAINKANKLHGWDIKWIKRNSNLGTFAEIKTETTEEILYLGIYIGKLL